MPLGDWRYRRKVPADDQAQVSAGTLSPPDEFIPAPDAAGLYPPRLRAFLAAHRELLAGDGNAQAEHAAIGRAPQSGNGNGSAQVGNGDGKTDGDDDTP